VITIISLELIKSVVCNIPITVKAQCSRAVIFYHYKIWSYSNCKSCCYKAVCRCLSLIHWILGKFQV